MKSIIVFATYLGETKTVAGETFLKGKRKCIKICNNWVSNVHNGNGLHEYASAADLILNWGDIKTHALPIQEKDLSVRPGFQPYSDKSEGRG